MKMRGISYETGDITNEGVNSSLSITGLPDNNGVAVICLMIVPWEHDIHSATFTVSDILPVSTLR